MSTPGREQAGNELGAGANDANQDVKSPLID
jgi:hypothetical protein